MNRHPEKTKLVTEANEIIFRAETLRFGVPIGSGRVVPLYWDSRIALAHPTALRAIATSFAAMVDTMLGVDVIAGCETSGISIAAATSLETNLPWVYIRKQEKGHSENRVVEGTRRSELVGVLVDDVIATGATKAALIKAARSQVTIRWVCVILDDSGGSYRDWTDREDIVLASLFTYDELLHAVRQLHRLPAVVENAIEAYKGDRDDWHVNFAIEQLRASLLA